MTRIHPTAIVEPDAEIGDGVTIGPYAVVESGARIGDGCAIGPHCVVHSHVAMGRNNRLHAHVVLGGPPQDLSWDGSDTRVEIGDDNDLREGVTIHRATRLEEPTRLGSGCFLMAYSHLAHDCQVGNGVILTNNVGLGGHVRVGDRAVFGGGALAHQFCRIGSLAMVSGLAGVGRDVLPYTLVHEAPARHYRLNTVGLRRAGVTGDRYRALEGAFRALRAGRGLDDLPATPELDHLREWLAAPSKRGLAGFVVRTPGAGRP